MFDHTQKLKLVLTVIWIHENEQKLSTKKQYKHKQKKWAMSNAVRLIKLRSNTNKIKLYTGKKCEISIVLLATAGRNLGVICITIECDCVRCGRRNGVILKVYVGVVSVV